MSNVRRIFVKRLGAVVAAAAATVATVSPARAFSTRNPGRDAKDPRYVGQEGKRWGMVIDLSKCIGCQACTAACKAENTIPDRVFRTWVPEYELGRYPRVRKAFLPQLCNHCEKPSCVSVCPTGATFARKDGVVVVDSKICWGCGYCLNACPYDKRYFNPLTQVADKCTYCAHRIDEGLLPACVESCVGGARIFGDLNDPKSEVSRLVSSAPSAVLNPASGTRPQTYYRNLAGELQAQPPGPPILDDLARKRDGLPAAEWTTKA
ncbi:4Fe-4S dicluster domain-containing protein [Desulfuromonas sp. KJ2020]|uniref:sulfate reduction electron transfer complex DsrMKJOP subunit DsrO n=1 Tax=Desulfuromonas sp. KJ2020 TaxID=2919173 RepID=UPI0020A6E5FF|nr:4Fe-4S dicluster domain-containing protein [Desulfuromonas sp. KJ2020]